MKESKKIFSVLSQTVITGLIVVAVGTTVVKAKPVAISIDAEDNKTYEYQYQALRDSALAEVLNGKDDPQSKLYIDFVKRKKSIKAYYDDVRKAYISADIISEAAIKAVTGDTPFDFIAYLENSSTPITTLATPNKVAYDANGNLSIVVPPPPVVPVPSSDGGTYVPPTTYSVSGIITSHNNITFTGLTIGLYTQGDEEFQHPVGTGIIEDSGVFRINSPVVSGDYVLRIAASSETQEVTSTIHVPDNASYNITINSQEVAVGSGSVQGATAGDSTITGLVQGLKYIVTKGTNYYGVLADGTLSEAQTDRERAEDLAAALTGSAITGLTNGYIYKVEALTTPAELLINFTQGSTPGTTSAMAIPTNGNTLVYKISNAEIRSPYLGDTVTGTSPLAIGEDISGVDTVNNKYLAVYEIDGNGHVVGFSSTTLTSSSISPILVQPATTTAGAITLSPANGNRGASQNIEVIYTPGETMTNGTVLFTLPEGFSADLTTDKFKIADGEETALNQEEIGNNGQTVTLTDVNASTSSAIVLKLINKTIPDANTYNFKVAADSDGLGTAKTWSAGTETESAAFVSMPTCVISGRVNNPNGVVLSGCGVSLESAGGALIALGTLNADGTYTIITPFQDEICTVKLIGSYSGSSDNININTENLTDININIH
ncbi:hypothetical protein Ccar_13860 [Clostridium carboxidivorans P7]|uniref:S-layer protein SbsC C-terminal domain-containing protein n=1 Tax=Clostridium carboxidivorans P7 TaxID=536227 RepID=C6PZK4_9CLOT|nr:BslA/BslB family hydrophobin [Clostridium carboxidivorans]AKN31886.1 hypothetical protein Ccar_13860 [Clostridium carboxidivorans P7]EET85316.1 hypothetical protein CcarbDRAFT_4221 [Clostridium carboxidivorans P7]